MKPLLIVKTGETMPELRSRRGDFEDWIAGGFEGVLDTAVVAPYAGDRLPAPENFSGVVISGSHAMVTDRAAWSEHTAVWIQEVMAAEIPLLGICYGHQLIAHALGGRVGDTPGGAEVGMTEIRLRAEAMRDPLFCQIPATMQVHASHTQSAVRLPKGAVCLASNAHEPHHAFSVGSSTWGLQFHPEFDAEIMKAYLDEYADLVRAAGKSPSLLKRSTRDTPISRSILRRFAGIVRERS